MAKVLNAVFGIGIGAVVFALILLGIQAFYPAPEYSKFCNQTTYYTQPFDLGKCPDNMTVSQCRNITNQQPASLDASIKCQAAYDSATQIYNRNYFIIACILGVATLIAGFLVLHFTNISAGLVCSAIVLILYAFIRGWSSTDNKLKFFVGIIVAGIIIALAIKVNKKLGRKK